jgi:hypothetical protein
MKKSVLIILTIISLSGCVQPLTREQIAPLSAYDLCTYRIQDAGISTAIMDRKIDCQKEIVKGIRKEVKTLSIPDLCAAWYINPFPVAVQEIINEVKKRNVDCATIIQKMQQEAAISEQAYLNALANQHPVNLEFYPISPRLVQPTPFVQPIHPAPAVQPIRSYSQPLSPAPDPSCIRTCQNQGFGYPRCTQLCAEPPRRY